VDVVLPAAQLPHAGRLAPTRRLLNVGSSAAQRPPAAAMNPSAGEWKRRGAVECRGQKQRGRRGDVLFG